MIAVVASASILALVPELGGNRETSGTPYGAAAALAIASIAILARGRRDLASALTSIACGIAVGWPLIQDGCAPVGILYARSPAC